MGSSSVLLDPIYFGSGNSFHESMFYGTQTVTCPTKYIKSRIVSAAYAQMEIKNPPIVKDKGDYVNKAIEIANDENILDMKKDYQKSAIENRLNTADVGVKFNSFLKKLLETALLILGKSISIFRPAPRFIWPTSELPTCDGGNPTASPWVSNFALG